MRPFLSPFSLSAGVAILCAVPLAASAAGDGTSTKDVKAYLTKTVDAMKAASEDFVKASNDYTALVTAHEGKLDAAYAAEPKKVDAVVTRLQEDYKKMDSFGYETIEGIVAGVDSMKKYDTYLDAGVPASEGPENIAPVTLTLSTGEKIDKEGCLFTYIIEPALWGGNKKWVQQVGGKSLPRPELIAAAAKDVDAKIGELKADSHAWNPSVEDLFGAMVLMTPTLSDYFEDWKESRFADEKSGRFQAVSRISDMRGIMSSCSVMYKAVLPAVSSKDKALAKSVDKGFDGILSFVALIGKREQEGKIKAAEIDELASQAKEKTDKLVPQIEQSAALIGVKTGN